MNILNIEGLMELESRKSFEYFWAEANTDKNSPGYGLIRDRAPANPNLSSIAAVGFGLTAYTIGVKNGWVSAKDAYERALLTITCLYNHAEHVNGFFYHFLNLYTAKRVWNCEVSIVDTAILLCGAITCGEFFGGEVKEKAQILYERMNWEWFQDKKTNWFYLGYTPEKGFFGAWDSYAEQLMMYFLAFSSPTYPVKPDMFYSFKRDVANYNNIGPIIYSFSGSIFTYQFSHGWFDLRNLKDREGIDWFENSRLATLAARQYCIDYSDKFKTFGENSWGLTACDGPSGYSGMYGAMPRKTESIHFGNDGTVTPCAAIGSIVFTPDESQKAMTHYYENYPQLWGKYGFTDAFNLDVQPNWFGKDFLGIDKGISLLMIENYRTGFVWDTFMKNKYVKEGVMAADLTRYINTEKEQISA